ncbi:hypothetical protein EDEG_04179, partial [Edhazardia aedis USNM 41457]
QKTLQENVFLTDTQKTKISFIPKLHNSLKIKNHIKKHIPEIDYSNRHNFNYIDEYKYLERNLNKSKNIKNVDGINFCKNTSAYKSILIITKNNGNRIKISFYNQILEYATIMNKNILISALNRLQNYTSCLKMFRITKYEIQELLTIQFQSPIYNLASSDQYFAISFFNEVKIYSTYICNDTILRDRGEENLITVDLKDKKVDQNNISKNLQILEIAHSSTITAVDGNKIPNCNTSRGEKISLTSKNKKNIREISISTHKNQKKSTENSNHPKCDENNVEKSLEFKNEINKTNIIQKKNIEFKKHIKITEIAFLRKFTSINCIKLEKFFNSTYLAVCDAHSGIYLYVLKKKNAMRSIILI